MSPNIRMNRTSSEWLPQGVDEPILEPIQLVSFSQAIRTLQRQCPGSLGPGSHHLKAFETSLEGLCCLHECRINSP